MGEEANDKHIEEITSGEVIITARCQGITPLLMHAMHPDTIQEVLIEGQRPIKDTDLKPRERCEILLQAGQRQPDGRERNIKL